MIEIVSCSLALTPMLPPAVALPSMTAEVPAGGVLISAAMMLVSVGAILLTVVAA